MTHDCHKLLKDLRKFQPDEGKPLLFIEPIDGTEGCFRNTATDEKIPLPFSTPKTRSILDDLAARGYVSFPYPSVLLVSHAGWHTKYMTWEVIRNFLVKSVLVPIAVSLATSILTVFVLRYIGG